MSEETTPAVKRTRNYIPGKIIVLEKVGEGFSISKISPPDGLRDKVALAAWVKEQAPEGEYLIVREVLHARKSVIGKPVNVIEEVK